MLDLFHSALSTPPVIVTVLLQAVTSEWDLAKEAALDAALPSAAYSSFPSTVLFPAMAMTASLFLCRGGAEVVRAQALSYNSEAICRSNSSIP